METLQTNRLILRCFEDKDDKDLYAYAKNPKVGPNAGWKPHSDLKESQRIIHLFILNQDVWAIEDKKTHKVIGSIGLHKDQKRELKKALMLGFVLSEDYWGQGIIKEASEAVVEYAFTSLKAEIVSAYCYPFNHQSKRVIEKIGFKYEGCLRKASLLYDGRILDDLCFSITKEDYFSQ